MPAVTPQYVNDLAAAYGAPSQAGFGSAVFYEHPEPDADLEQVALHKYQYFVGDLWERFGEEAWMSAWQLVYTRPSADEKPGIVTELSAIAHPEVAQLVPILLSVDDSETALKALSVAYDAPDIVDLRVYAIGDGAAMSGLLIAGCRATHEITVLVLLLD